VDVWRGHARPQRNPLTLALYISMFPQLIAGPIVRYRDVERQLTERRVERAGFADGVQRFTLGLAKKMLIANSLALPADRIFALPADELTAGLSWLAVGCYTAQIYFDFSGYSDMAIGLGRMFGFRFRENFDHPDSLETDFLISHLEALRRGEAIERPVYDFSTHTRTTDTVRVDPDLVVIVEGILVLTEADLRALMDLRIYVDTDADLRLVRRLRRDILERGRTVDSVLRQFESTVRPMHLQFVEPSKRYADFIVPDGYNPSVVGTVTSLIRDFLATR